MTDTAYKIKVMQHYKDGGAIEYCPRNGAWVDYYSPIPPCWNWEDVDYRIKEEPKAKTLYFYENPRGIVETFSVEADAEACKLNDWELVHEIELTPKQEG